uniref:Uncharacterized protein n=1 Tax=Anopheles farauti TaxID=69004 RepID=A0A182Q1S3_9DIPT
MVAVAAASGATATMVFSWPATIGWLEPPPDLRDDGFAGFLRPLVLSLFFTTGLDYLVRSIALGKVVSLLANSLLQRAYSTREGVIWKYRTDITFTVFTAGSVQDKRPVALPHQHLIVTLTPSGGAGNVKRKSKGNR